MSKGSTARPIPDRNSFESNWDAVFKKTKEQFNDGQREQPQALQQPPVRDRGDTGDRTHELLPR